MLYPPAWPLWPPQVQTALTTDAERQLLSLASKSSLTAFESRRSSPPPPDPYSGVGWPSSLAHGPAASQKQGSMRPENGAAQARDAHLARIPEPFGAIEAASLRNDGRYHHAVDLGSWMCFQASSAGPSAYCFAFSRKEGMSSKHCRAGPSRCSPARSGRVGLPLPRWLLPEVNSRSYAPRLRRVGVLRIELGSEVPPLPRPPAH